MIRRYRASLRSNVSHGNAITVCDRAELSKRFPLYRVREIDNMPAHGGCAVATALCRDGDRGKPHRLWF